ncbi:MAG: hypothetical protein QUT30_03350, partial [Acidobacteriota bacterium]|nr:hypothetical protein [Acidobacteriota bacterium]
ASDVYKRQVIHSQAGSSIGFPASAGAKAIADFAGSGPGGPGKVTVFPPATPGVFFIRSSEIRI